MTAENVYLYLFLVGVFFTVGNFAISGISHVVGGIGGGSDGGGDTGGGDAIDMDANATIGDSGGFDGADTGFDGGTDAGFDSAADMGFDGGANAGFDTGDGMDAGFDSGGGTDAGFDAGGDTHFDAVAAGAVVDSVAVDLSGGAGAGAGSASGHYAAGSHGAAESHGASSVTGASLAAGDSPAGDSLAGASHAGVSHAGADAAGAHAPQSHTGGPNLLSLLTTWLPLRPTALICFSTVTGGVGTIFLRLGWETPLTHICSIASGYGLSMLLGVALPRRLRRAQNTSAAERYELIGLSAQVTSAILEGGFGRISYTVRDNAFSAPARHIEGKRVPQGSRVVICEIKDNVFYVTELNL